MSSDKPIIAICWKGQNITRDTLKTWLADNNRHIIEPV